MLNKDTLEGIELSVLIALVLAAYIVGMVIQVRDKEIKIDRFDWVLSFMSSFIGATITYFGVFSWVNQGIKIGFTVLASLITYPIFKFIVSKKGRDGFIQLFKNKIGIKEEKKNGNI